MWKIANHPWIAQAAKKAANWPWKYIFGFLTWRSVVTDGVWGYKSVFKSMGLFSWNASINVTNGYKNWENINDG